MADATSAALRLAAVALALGSATATGARGETLADAIAMAYAGNPSLQGQRAAVQAADETYAQARAQMGLRAEVTGDASYAEYRGLPFQSNPLSPLVGHQESRSTQVGVSLSQLLYNGGRTRAAMNAAEADILTQRQNLRLSEMQLVQQVIAAYTAVRRDGQILSVYGDTLQALQRQFDQTQAEFAVRQVTQTDVDITKGRLAAAKANVANAAASLEISRSRYLALVGAAPGELAPEPDLPGLPATIDAAFDAAEARNPQVLAAQFQEQAAGFRVSEARRQYLPTVQVQVQGTEAPYLPYAPRYGDQRVVTATVGVTQPLYTSGLFGSQVRQALAQQNQARAQVELNRRTAVQGVSQAWSQLIAARASLSADEAGVTSTQAAFYGVRREEPFGLRQPIDVLNAQEELNSAEIRVLQDRYNEYTSRAAVMASAGLLEASLIAPGAQGPDLVKDFRRVRDQGALPWEAATRALDSVGVGGLHDPKAPRRDDRTDRLHTDLPLPPAPPPASQNQPFTPSAEIMAAAPVDGPPPGAPNSGAPLSRCTLRQSEREGCAAGAATDAATPATTHAATGQAPG